MRRGTLCAAATALLTCLQVQAQVRTQTTLQPASPPPTPTAPRAHLATLDYRLQAREVAPQVFVVEGDNDDFAVANGCNIINTGFVVTAAGVLVVNTGTSKRYGEQLRALIQRTTTQAVAQVLHLNLHPDYFLGNQAFADVPRYATARTRAGMAREAAAYESNLYRLCGEWMKGTEHLLPDRDLDAAVKTGRWSLGGREFELLEFQGHTDSDLVLVDKATGVAFAGGLVFAQRVPTTPHAQVGPWIKSLEHIQGLPWRTVVPSHGPVHPHGAGAAGTKAFLQWLDQTFKPHANNGLDMNEVLRAPVPREYTNWAAFATEYVRNVAHLYPRYERAAWSAATSRP
jgi:quinoprotein relay system zinc metallohydrolase 1